MGSSAEAVRDQTHPGERVIAIQIQELGESGGASSIGERWNPIRGPSRRDSLASAIPDLIVLQLGQFGHLIWRG